MANLVKLTTRKMMRQEWFCRFGVTPLLFCQVSRLAAEHDKVQGSDGTKVPCALLLSFPSVSALAF